MERRIGLSTDLTVLPSPRDPMHHRFVAWMLAWTHRSHSSSKHRVTYRSARTDCRCGGSCRNLRASHPTNYKYVQIKRAGALVSTALIIVLYSPNSSPSSPIYSKEPKSSTKRSEYVLTLRAKVMSCISRDVTTVVSPEVTVLPARRARMNLDNSIEIKLYNESAKKAVNQRIMLTNVSVMEVILVVDCITLRSYVQ